MNIIPISIPITPGRSVRCPGGTAQGEPRPELRDQIGKVRKVDVVNKKAEVTWPRGRVYTPFGKVCHDERGTPYVDTEHVWHAVGELEVVD